MQEYSVETLTGLQKFIKLLYGLFDIDLEKLPEPQLRKNLLRQKFTKCLEKESVTQLL